MGIFDKNKAVAKAANNGDPFDRVGNAETTERSVYPAPGIYPILFCDQLKMITSKLSGDDIFVAEFEIIESKVDERPAGSHMSWLCNLRHMPAAGNIRTFLAALNGVAVEEVDAEGARHACSETNPCHGRLIRLDATITMTKKDQPFTLCRWTAIPEATQAKANELREKAGLVPF